MKNSSRNLCTLLLAGTITTPALLFAHELGAPFSGAILDPTILHHAHIENEQRFNFFALQGMTDHNGVKHFGYQGELELAYGSPSYRYGFELFLPVSNLAAPDGQGRVMGLGDMEVRPLKYALLMKPDLSSRPPAGSASLLATSRMGWAAATLHLHNTFLPIKPWATGAPS